MKLDPHIQGALQMLAGSSAKPMAEGSVAEGRDGYRQLTVATRSPEQVVPVGSVEDIQVRGAAGSLDARLYRPEGGGPRPTIVYFHGGGWVIGDLDTHDNMCRDICRGADAVVLSVDYRLAPEHPFPAGIQDALAATLWVVAHEDQLGGNGRVAVAGDSAGGNFAAVVAQQMRDIGRPLAAQFLIYPSVDDLSVPYASVEENGEGYFLDKAAMAWFLDHYLGATRGDAKNGKIDPRLAPLHAQNLSSLPPALIVTAGFDPLRDAGRAYSLALTAAGNESELMEAPGMIHGFFDMGRWSPGAQAFIERSISRFGEKLRDT